MQSKLSSNQTIVDVWADFRQLMPVTKRWSYLDHAAVAALPRPSREIMTEWASDFAENGDANWLDWHNQLQHFRTDIAKMISASADEIAFVPSTTTGINFVAEGYPWQPGDNVVTLSNEFPSNLYPWFHQESRGVEVRSVEVPPRSS